MKPKQMYISKLKILRSFTSHTNIIKRTTFNRNVRTFGLWIKQNLVSQSAPIMLTDYAVREPIAKSGWVLIEGSKPNKGDLCNLTETI